MGRIRVGKPDTKPDTPSHVSGIHEGNEGRYESQPGHHPDGTADARRSTGVQWKKHDPVSETMPNLPPG
ncbi:hypothetical protein N566_13370 [Streptomycetaceae bacterium MP113-05]|nr:hypothetical protein N566_13370 [Streptomycetaceae bacterium MP113-05]